MLYLGLPQPPSKAVLDPTKIENCGVEEYNKFDIFAKFVESTDILEKAYLEECSGAGEK